MEEIVTGQAGSSIISHGRWKRRGRDIAPVVFRDGMPMPKEGEGEESGGLCLKTSLFPGLHVILSTLFSARLSH